MTKLRLLPALLALVLTACQPDAGNAPAGQNAPGGGSQAVSGATSGGTGAKRGATVAVQAETVKAGPLQVTNNVAGTVAAAVQSSVAAGTSGTVRSLSRSAGDW